MYQLICAFLSHTHYNRYEVGMLKVPAMYRHDKSKKIVSRSRGRCRRTCFSNDCIHIVVTTRYSEKQRSKSRQKVTRFCKQWYRFIMTRLIYTGKLTRSRSLMSPCCKAVKDDSRKHTVNLFLLLLPGGCRTNSEQGGNTVGSQNPKKGVVRKLSSFH